MRQVGAYVVLVFSLITAGCIGGSALPAVVTDKNIEATEQKLESAESYTIRISTDETTVLREYDGSENILRVREMRDGRTIETRYYTENGAYRVANDGTVITEIGGTVTTEMRLPSLLVDVELENTSLERVGTRYFAGETVGVYELRGDPARRVIEEDLGRSVAGEAPPIITTYATNDGRVVYASYKGPSDVSSMDVSASRIAVSVTGINETTVTLPPTLQN